MTAVTRCLVLELEADAPGGGLCTLEEVDENVGVRDHHRHEARISTIALRSFPLTFKRRGSAGFTFAMSPAARDSFLRSMIRDSVARVPCISLWPLAEVYCADTLSSTGSCDSNSEPLRDVGGREAAIRPRYDPADRTARERESRALAQCPVGPAGGSPSRTRPPVRRCDQLAARHGGRVRGHRARTPRHYRPLGRSRVAAVPGSGAIRLGPRAPAWHRGAADRKRQDCLGYLRYPPHRIGCTVPGAEARPHGSVVTRDRHGVRGCRRTLWKWRSALGA